jgi:SAM-dependent methyltransferase
LRKETEDALRALNRRFYQERAAEFSRTRERPWSGWSEILSHARELLPERPRVLDVGCGNGRFGRFLEGSLGRPFDYVGVDESPLALAAARRRLSREAVLLEHDVLESNLPEAVSARRFDWVALFGVLHHVPGRENRRHLLQRLSALVAPGGLLTFSVWLCDRVPEIAGKIVPWERTGIPVDAKDLEPGDRILTWGGADSPALRFCHWMSEEEEAEIQSSFPLELFLRFDSADEPNRYFVYRLPPA